MIFLLIQAEFGGMTTKVAELNDAEGALSWTLLQETFEFLEDGGSFAFFIQGDVGAASPDTGESVIAIDDYSLTSTVCPLVSV